MNRGEVWLANLNPTVGAEMQKIRPVVIVSDDQVGTLPLKVVVPLTDWKDWLGKVSWMVKVVPLPATGLSKLSAADAFQVRSVAYERFTRQLGKLDAAIMQEIADALAVVLGI